MTRPEQLQLLGENWVTEHCTIEASSGTGTVGYLYDQKPATRWLSENSDDTKDETITITFYNRFGVVCARDIDRVILLNTNAKAVSVATITEGVETAFGTAIGDAENIIIEGTPINCDGLKITISTTQVADEDKAVGELKACLYLMTANALTELERADTWKAGSYRVRSGSLVRWREYTKYSATETLSNLTLAQRNIINAAIDDYSFLTFILYGSFDLSAVYEFAVAEAPSEKFDRISERYELQLALEER